MPGSWTRRGWRYSSIRSVSWWFSVHSECFAQNLTDCLHLFGVGNKANGNGFHCGGALVTSDFVLTGEYRAIEMQLP